jgi:hypothetical protein
MTRLFDLTGSYTFFVFIALIGACIGRTKQRFLSCSRKLLIVSHPKRHSCTLYTWETCIYDSYTYICRHHFNQSAPNQSMRPNPRLRLSQPKLLRAQIHSLIGGPTTHSPSLTPQIQTHASAPLRNSPNATHPMQQQTSTNLPLSAFVRNLISAFPCHHRTLSLLWGITPRALSLLIDSFFFLPSDRPP